METEEQQFQIENSYPSRQEDREKNVHRPKLHILPAIAYEGGRQKRAA